MVQDDGSRDDSKIATARRTHLTVFNECHERLAMTPNEWILNQVQDDLPHPPT